jgi:hypothetical protein
MMSLIQSIPRVSPTPRALAMSDPDQGGHDANQDREPDRHVLAAGRHQPAQGPDDVPDDDAADHVAEAPT